MKHPLCRQMPKSLGVGSNERTNPHHDLESPLMQITNHSPRIVETIRSEFPISVTLLPIVINHHDASRVAITQNSRSICADILLVLIIDQLNPCVVLRRSEQQRVRDFAV